MGRQRRMGKAGARGQKALLGVVAFVILVFIASPVLVVLPLSFSDARGIQFPPEAYSLRRFRDFFGATEWLNALWTSAKVSFFAVLIATPLGTAMALGLVRGKFFGRKLLNSFVILPLIFPTLIYGLALLFLYRRFGIYDTELGLVLAYVVIALPFIVLITAARFRSFDESLELTAMSLGANWWQAFFKVTLPLTWTGIAAAAIVAFIIAFDELIIALFISRIQEVTLPVKMFNSLELEVDPLLAVVASFLIINSLILAGLAALFARVRHE